MRYSSVVIPVYRRFSTFLCGCTVLLILVQPVQAQALQAPFPIEASTSAAVVEVSVRLPKDGVRAGTRFEVFVMVDVALGWHVNAHEPTRKYLIGTALDVAPPAGLRVEGAYYPDPLFRTFGFTADTLAVYEGEIAVILAMRAAETLAPGSLAVPGRLRVQACNDQVCLRPSQIDVEIPVEIVEG